LKKILEQFVLEKFISKNTNANQCIDFFEKECTRFDIEKDDQKIEILRLFMGRLVQFYAYKTNKRLGLENLERLFS